MKNTRMTKKIIAAVIAFAIIFSAIGCEAQSASGGGTTANVGTNGGEATSFTPTVAPNTSAPDLTSAPTEETTVPNVETTVPDVTTATPETTLTPDTTTAPIEETTVPDETTAPDVTTEETTAPDITTAPDVTTATPETTITPETTATPETTVAPETTAPAPETEAPHVHTPETVKGTAATCTKDGLTDGVRCATCKATLTAQTKIEAKGHTPETVKGTAATCTKDGLTDGVRCATCKATLTAQTKIEAKGHTPETVKGTAATCTKSGLTDGVRCAACKTTLTAQTKIEAKGHTPEAVKGTAATCTKDGLTDGVRCATCKATLTAQTKIEAKGHSYTVTKEPNLDPYSADFAADGEKTCGNCGKTAAVRAQAPAIDSEEYARLLANRLLYYINLIRVEEGNLPAQMLPNMTEYAEYRAVQLSTNFAHDSADEAAAATALKYGQYNYGEITYLDPETWEVIHTGEYREYYAPCCGEAIGSHGYDISYYGNSLYYLEKRASTIAEGYHNSEGHWAYVGRDENVFISIGCFVDVGKEWAYSCICTSPSDIYG